MKSKVLFCASTADHLKNFHLPYINWIVKNDYLLDILCQGELCVDIDKNENFNMTFSKTGNPFSLMDTILKVTKIIKKNRYETIIVHTTLASGVVRLALMLAGKKDTKLIYINHGYLFTMHTGLRRRFEIACEKILSYVTDGLVTMNKEDFELAKKYKFCKEVYFINGMGIEQNKLPTYSEEEINELKRRLNISKEIKVFTCVAEFSGRKNQQKILNSISSVLARYSNIHFIFAGEGSLFKECKELVNSLGIENHVTFLGYYNQIPLLLQSSDFIVSASKCEGMPFNIMEGLYYGKQIIASHIKGHIDLIKDIDGCYLFDLEKKDDFEEKVNKALRKEYNGKIALDTKYTFEECFEDISRIYRGYLPKE